MQIGKDSFNFNIEVEKEKANISVAGENVEAKFTCKINLEKFVQFLEKVKTPKWWKSRPNYITEDKRLEIELVVKNILQVKINPKSPDTSNWTMNAFLEYTEDQIENLIKKLKV